MEIRGYSRRQVAAAAYDLALRATHLTPVRLEQNKIRQYINGELNGYRSKNPPQVQLTRNIFERSLVQEGLTPGALYAAICQNQFTVRGISRRTQSFYVEILISKMKKELRMKNKIRTAEVNLSLAAQSSMNKLTAFYEKEWQAGRLITVPSEKAESHLKNDIELLRLNIRKMESHSKLKEQAKSNVPQNGKLRFQTNSFSL
jgi:hypothetical protein